MASGDDNNLVDMNATQINKLNNILAQQTELVQQVNKSLTLQRTDVRDQDKLEKDISDIQKDIANIQSSISEGFQSLDNEVTNTTDKTITYLGNTYTYNEDDNLYYFIIKRVGREEENVIDDDEVNVEVRYVSMLPLSTSDWLDETIEVATYEGIRYDPTGRVNLKLFRETLQIFSLLDDGTQDGTIRASSIYIDAGEGTITTVDSAYFPVECADGKYSDVKIIKILYDNDTYADRNVRTLQLLK